MATRGNFVSLYGYVHTINIIPEQSCGLASIVVSRSDRSTGDTKKKEADLILVMTNRQDQLEEMMRWSEYDIVEVKGVIATIPREKGKKLHFCKECGHSQITYGTAAYVYPQFLKLRQHFEGDEETRLNKAIAALKENKEISNLFNCFAYLCKDPKRKILENGLKLTEYQVVIHRAYRIDEDDQDRKEDFVWVKSYGKNGIEDHLHLRTSSQIYIDGLLQSRKVLQKATCEECGATYNWEDRVLEIVPYSVQYISGCLSDEEVAAQEKKKLDQQEAEVLSKLKGTKPKSEDAFAGIDFGETMETEE